jgi:hypothetical protein
MTIHTRLHMRTGDEIRATWIRAHIAWGAFAASDEQCEWTLTFLTLPPSASDLEEAA